MRSPELGKACEKHAAIPTRLLRGRFRDCYLGRKVLSKLYRRVSPGFVEAVPTDSPQDVHMDVPPSHVSVSLFSVADKLIRVLTMGKVLTLCGDDQSSEEW